MILRGNETIIIILSRLQIKTTPQLLQQDLHRINSFNSEGTENRNSQLNTSLTLNTSSQFCGNLIFFTKLKYLIIPLHE